jgi:hypothetical protein
VTHGKCQAHSCRQWATQWAWFEDGRVTAKVWLCKPHFDLWALPPETDEETVARAADATNPASHVAVR